MKNKKTYHSAEATFIAVTRDDVICASGGFDGPNDPFFPKMISEFREDSESETE